MLPRQPVSQILHVCDVKILLFETSGSSSYTASLWAIDGGDNILWCANNGDGIERYIAIDEADGDLFATTFSGWRHQIDMQTGSVIEQRFTK